MATETSSPLLLCLDLEAGSEQLAAYAAAHARRCSRPVRVLHVTPASLDGRHRTRVHQHLQALVDAHLGGIALAGLEVTEEVAEEIIVATAARHDVDLILLGRRQRRTVERIYVGSTTSAVLSLAHRPILVVPIDTGTGARA